MDHVNSSLHDKILAVIFVSLIVCTFAVALAPPVDNAVALTVLTSKWTRTSMPGGGEGIVIGDIDNDGIQEVVYSASNRAVALRGTTGATVWDVTVTGAIDTTQPQMADLDKDGYLEIVVPIIGPPAGFYILDGRDGSKEQTTTIAGRCDNGPVIADITGDGYPTLFFATMSLVESTDDSNSSGWLRSYKYNSGASPKYREVSRTRIWHPCSGGLSLADADHDGVFELYMNDRHM